MAPSSTPCRPSQGLSDLTFCFIDPSLLRLPGACDVAEYCDGVNGACPTDYFVGPGTPCTAGAYGAGLCYLGTCQNAEYQCRVVGDQFSGAPYDQCPVDTQTYLNSARRESELFEC